MAVLEGRFERARKLIKIFHLLFAYAFFLLHVLRDLWLLFMSEELRQEAEKAGV